jgi:hypothetical protein
MDTPEQMRENPVNALPSCAVCVVACSMHVYKGWFSTSGEVGSKRVI